MSPPKITNAYLVAALATIGGLIQGFDVSSMSAIIATKQYKTYFHKPGSVEQGGITASMAGGSLLGALFSSWTGDKFGRRDTMFIACIIWIIGSVLMCAVQDVAMLIVARIVNGFAVGMLTSQGPVYIAEVSLPTTRGRLISIQQWMITWGILIMYFISYGTSFLSTNASFRVPWGLQMIPAIVLMAFIPFLPRSPRWLAKKDRWDEALEVLAALHAKGNKLDPKVVAEVQEIRERVHLELQYSSTSWLELFKKRNIVRVHCAIFTHIWSQYTGTNAMMYYIVYIFSMAGLTGNNTLVAASIQYVINVGMTIPALIWIDRFPRRLVMMTGSFVMAFFLFTEGALMAVYGHAVPGGLNGVAAVTWVVDSGPASRSIIACSYLFIATYATTWGPIGWIYPAEITPLYIRAKAVSLATFFNWACNFALTFFTPPGFQNIQWRVYMIFGTFCLAAFVHVFLLFPETRGLSLEEMDTLFDDTSNIWAFRKSKIQYTLDQRAEAVRHDLEKVDYEGRPAGGKADIVERELVQGIAKRENGS